MPTVTKFITDVSAGLNDQKIGKEFTRWTMDMMLTYLNLGMAEISGHKPEAFTNTLPISLDPGSVQGIDSHQRVISVDSNADGTPVHEADLDLLRAYGTYGVAVAPVEFDSFGNPVYYARSYSIDPKNPRNFYISPPVPPGINPIVQMTVQIAVPEYTNANLGDEIPLEAKYITSLWDYVMGRAFELDTESRESAARSQTHMQSFWTAMDIKYKKEASYRNGYYNGQIGEGDSRVVS